MSFLDSVKGSDEGSSEGSGEGPGAGGGTTVFPVCFRLVFLGLGSFTPTFFAYQLVFFCMRCIHVSWEKPHQNHPTMGSQCSCKCIQIDPTLDTIPWFSSIRVLGKSSTEFERSDSIRENRTRSGRSFDY